MDVDGNSPTTKSDRGGDASQVDCEGSADDVDEILRGWSDVTAVKNCRASCGRALSPFDQDQRKRVESRGKSQSVRTDGHLRMGYWGWG